MIYKHQNRGTCSSSVTVEIENGILVNASFEGGCGGNTKGICALVQGMKAEDVIQRLKGIRCGFKNTSCPDQLAQAVEQALAQND